MQDLTIAPETTAESGESAPFRYDRKSIVLHWITAIFVASLWIVAQIIDDFPRGPLRVDARSVHIALGLALAAVLAVRLMWRNRGSSALAPGRSGIMEKGAHLGHILLYALAILAVLLGIANFLARGDSVFNLFAIPPLDGGNRELRELIGAAHGWIANTLLIVAIGHAALALFHHYVLRDDVLGRMLPVSPLGR